MDRLGTEEILHAGLDDWRKLAQALHARYRISDIAAAASFVAEVAAAAQDAGEHLDVKLGRGVVDLSLCTRQDGLWVTDADIALARTITALARQRGFEAEPAAVTQLELALDTADDKAAAPFWSALLTGSPDNQIYDSVFDPTGRVPSLWFQGTDAHETPRQRWHFDLWLAPEAAAERIAAAVAAGGRVVDDSGAPSFTVLADPEGNRVCVCTCLDRG